MLTKVGQTKKYTDETKKSELKIDKQRNII